MAVTIQDPSITPVDQTSQPKGRIGTGFTNIQQMIGANQGNQLGQAVGGGIQNQAQQVQQGIGQAQNQFQGATKAATDTSSGTTAQNQRDTTFKNITGYQAPSADSPQPQSSPGTVQTSSVNSPSPEATSSQSQPATQSGPLTAADTSNFSSLFNGTYSGPQNLSNASQLQTQAQQAQQLGQSISDPYARGALLKQFAAQGPQYTAGQQGLDSLLLGATGGNQLAQARRSTQGLTAQEQAAESAAQAQSGYAQNQAKNFGTDTQNQLANLGQSIYGNVTNQLNIAGQAQAQQIAQARALQAKINGAGGDINKLYNLSGNTGGLSAADLQTLGLSGISPDTFLGAIDPNALTQSLQGSSGQASLLNADGTPVTGAAEQVMTPTQQAQLLAIQQLAQSANATDMSKYNPDATLSAGTKVGSYNPVGLVDNTKLNQNLGVSQTELGNEYNQAVSNFVNQAIPGGSNLYGSVNPSVLANDPNLVALVRSGADRNQLIQHLQSLGIPYNAAAQSAAGLLASGLQTNPAFATDPRFQRLSNLISNGVTANV